MMLGCSTNPETKARLAEIGAHGAGRKHPDELQDYIASETAKSKAVIDRARTRPG